MREAQIYTTPEQMFSNIHFFYVIFQNRTRKGNSLLSFKNALLKLGRSVPNSCFNIHNPAGLKPLTRLRVGLSHLNEHKFKHNFSIVLIPYVPVVWKLNQVFVKSSLLISQILVK